MTRGKRERMERCCVAGCQELRRGKSKFCAMHWRAHKGELNMKKLCKYEGCTERRAGPGSNYCEKHRAEQHAVGVQAAVGSRKVCVKETQYCVDCGMPIYRYTRSGLCKHCSARRWRHDAEFDRKNKSVRLKFEWWYEGPPPTGKAIWQEG